MVKTVVTGDFIVDHHICEGRRLHFGDEVSPGVNVRMQAGGAALAHDLLAALFKPDREDIAPLWSSQLAVVVPSSDAEYLTINPSQNAYAFWRPFPSKTRQRSNTGV